MRKLPPDDKTTLSTIMADKTNTDNLEVYEGQAKGQMSLGRVIEHMLITAGTRAAEPLSMDPRADDAFRNSVKFIDSLLEIYQDTEYESRKNVIKGLSDPKDKIATTDEFFALLGLNMRQIKKAHMLPAQSIDLDDDTSPLDK
jgi:argininosuccinate lyase